MRDTARYSIPAVALLVAIGALAQPVAAQVIRIVEPAEWRDGRAINVAAGASVRIAGFASHPGGVSRVLVNGSDATLRPDPEFPTAGFRFEKLLPPDSIAASITITIVPATGSNYERTFMVELAAAAPPPPPPVREDPVPVTPPTDPAGGGESNQLRNPWGGFKVRGVAYGAAAVAGLVLWQLEKSETSEICEQTSGGLDCFNRTTTEPAYQSIGIGLAGGAAALFIIDALLTSRKAKSSPGPTGDGNGLRLERPQLLPRFDGARINLVRVRFR